MQWINPKQEGSRVCDCIPVPGKCPNDCPDCFYNRPGAFYAPLDQPVFPSLEYAKDKVVRINSGGDSNIQRDKVIARTNQYNHRFFNTSIPNLDFPAPVVLTINPKNFTDWFYAVSEIRNLMFVRVKITSWNGGLLDDVVWHYTNLNVPVVLTDMRFYTESLVLKLGDYEFRKHIKNPYWAMKHDVWQEIWTRYTINPLVLSCGSPRSPYCRDCENCWELYWYKQDGDEKRLARLKDQQIKNFGDRAWQK